MPSGKEVRVADAPVVAALAQHLHHALLHVLQVQPATDRAPALGLAGHHLGARQVDAVDAAAQQQQVLLPVQLVDLAELLLQVVGGAEVDRAVQEDHAQLRALAGGRVAHEVVGALLGGRHRGRQVRARAAVQVDRQRQEHAGRIANFQVQQQRRGEGAQQHPGLGGARAHHGAHVLDVDQVARHQHQHRRHRGVGQVRWRARYIISENPQHEITIGMVGKYVDLTESYKSLIEALRHAGIHTATRVNIEYLDSEVIESEGIGCLKNLDAILVPGGFGVRGTEGKISAIRYARENKVPYLGICLGMQLAVIEYARHMAGMKDANSTEFNLESEHPVVALITEWLDRDGKVAKRSADSDMGGTMRLGSQRCPVKPNTMAQRIYGDEVNERHRHRYEVNNHYVPALEKTGLIISARTPSEDLPEMMELPETMHPWFVGVQFHPEFTSTPRAGHPLFEAYVRAAVTHKESV